MGEILSKKVTIGGMEYNIDELGADVQNLIALHQKWKRDASEAKMEVLKSEAACKEVGRRILEAVNSSITDTEEVEINYHS